MIQYNYDNITIHELKEYSNTKLFESQYRYVYTHTYSYTESVL